MRAATILGIVAAFLCAPADAIGDAAAAEPVYLPGGVSDASGAVGCLRTPEGGLEAIELATGRSLWSSSAPARALLIARGRAFVLEERRGESLRLSVYDARSGLAPRAYDLASLALPAWATLGESRDGRRWTVFEATARLAGETLEIRYDASRMQVSGIPLPGPLARTEGVARLDLGSGRIERPTGTVPAPPPLSEPLPPAPGVRWVSCHARRPGPGLVLGGPPSNVDGAQLVDGRRLAFEMSSDAQTVIVHRWSGPGGRRETSLRLEHRRATDAVWMTSDRHHVLLRRANEQGWYELYSLESGALVGSLEGPVDVAVVGGRVFFTTRGDDGRLDFVATASGSRRPLWRRTLLEPERDLGEPIP